MEESVPGPCEESIPSVVELRQYALKPEKRDFLIELFEREFVDAQEAAGAQILGQFRDVDGLDRFVFLPGFPDMPRRATALETFYTSDTWKANRDAVNEVLVDYSNVLLLRPARPGSGLTAIRGTRRRSADAPRGMLTGTILSFRTPVTRESLDFFESRMVPTMARFGEVPIATYISEPSVNNYPKLPIREGENVFVWFSWFPDRVAQERHSAEISRDASWRSAHEKMSRWTKHPPDLLRLSPTAGSALQPTAGPP